MDSKPLASPFAHIGLVVLLVLLVALPRIAPAQQPSLTVDTQRGDQLLWQCDGKAVEQLLCVRYLEGFMDAFALQARIVPKEFRMVCLPQSGISNDQARRIVVKWLSDHPKELNESARSSVLLAFFDAFPCPK